MSMDPIVRFYSGGVDHRGRTVDEILAWSDYRLEAFHDLFRGPHGGRYQQ
jgi:hypothetical protein